MNYQLVKQQAVEFMMDRGWKQKVAKRRTFEQSLFDHTLTEIDALVTLLPLLQKTFVPSLADEEQQVLLASAIAHDSGKELAGIPCDGQTEASCVRAGSQRGRFALGLAHGMVFLWKPAWTVHDCVRWRRIDLEGAL